jgi:spore coat polysaccharide biosynthesis protein SpsF
MRVFNFIQARSTSSRLPGKIFKKIGDAELLTHVINNSRMANNDTLIVMPQKDDELERWLSEKNVPYYKSPNPDVSDVLDRFYQAALAYKVDYVVRLTSDCPFLNPATINYMVNVCISNRIDFMTNLPCVDGMDIEIMSMRALSWAKNKATDDNHKEHVTLYIKDNTENFKKEGMIYAKYTDNLLISAFPKLSIDTNEDLGVCRNYYNKLLEQRSGDGKTN